MIKVNIVHPEIINQYKVGALVEGTVLEQKGHNLFIDLGILGLGIVRGQEYLSTKNIIKNLKPEDLVSVKIIELENELGFIELSLRDINKEKSWLKIKEHFKKTETVKIKIMEANAGGLMTELYGIRGFLPASQLNTKHYPKVEGGTKEKILEELKKLVGEELEVKILDLDPITSKLIFSEKAVEYGELKKIMAQYKVGDVVDCTVTKVVDFGAFVKFGQPPIDGLIHISEFDYKAVNNPNDFLKENDQVKTKIISVDNNRISLSLKALKPDPFNEIEIKYQIGQVYPAKIIRHTSTGFLAELEPGLLTNLKVPLESSAQLIIDEIYPVKIISLDKKNKQINSELVI